MITGEGVNLNQGRLFEIRGWQDKATEESFLRVKSALRSFIAEMQIAFETEERYYRESLERETELYRNDIDDIKSRYLDEKNRAAEAEYNRTLSWLSSEWNGPEGTRTVKKANISALEFEFTDNSLLDKAVGLVRSGSDRRIIDDFDRRRAEVEGLSFKAEHAYEEVFSAAIRLRDLKIRLNNRIYEEIKREKVEAHNQRLEKIEAEYRRRKQVIYDSFNGEFVLYFNTGTFNDVWGNVRVFMKNAGNYSYSKSIPRNLYLGKRTFEIKAQSSFYPEVINMIKAIDFKGVSASAEKITITLPFFREIEEGYSVYIETKDASTEKSNNALRDYVWKILMNFTAGQTVPVLLDADITATLTCFKEIGENAGRKMVTSPWSDEEDIEREVSKVALEHTNLTTSYSGDTQARLEREPVYFVAARSFPKGFTKRAAQRLSKIFRAGSGNGFFGVVLANLAELTGQKDDEEWRSFVAAIKASSLYVSEENGTYYISDNGERDVFEFEAVMHSEDALNDIRTEIIAGVKSYSRQIEKFECLFSKDSGNIEKTDVHNVNTWYQSDAGNSFEVPLGISGASKVQKFRISGTAQHALLSGITGSGKSALLRTLIVGAMMKYSPQNVNFYLIDFKEGVEFESFSRYKLPWIKVIALNTQRIFALEILEYIKAEFEHRAEIMAQKGVNNISMITDEVFPRIILVFDEIQELLRADDEITEKCVQILATLVSEGRAMNVNVIIASQNFAVCNGIKDIKTNMAIRIAFPGAPESTKEIMGEDFDGSQLEQGGKGYGAINEASGEKGRTSFFSGGYLAPEELMGILAMFEATMANRRAETRIMSVHIERDRENKFNRFIRNSEVIPNRIASRYEMMLGDEFIINRRREYYISLEKGENMAVIGKSEKTARSIFCCAVLSALYGELASDAEKIKNELVRLIDLSDEDEENSDYFAFMHSLFPRQISRVGLSKSAEMINDTYSLLEDRVNGVKPSAERLFLMIFGIDSITPLRREKAAEGTLTLKHKLYRILQDGPEHGINCIVWSRSFSIFKDIFEDEILDNDISKRIYFGDNQQEANELTSFDENVKKLGEKTVLFKDTDKTTASTFRVFELPDRSWIAKIQEIYDKYPSDD